MLEKPVAEILDNPDKIYPESRAFGWHDITGQVLVRGVAATDPDWVQVAGGPMFCYRFSVNDSAWFVYHIPHDIVPNFPVFFHAHWMSSGTSTAAVTWEWSYMYAKGFNQATFDFTLATSPLTAAANTVTATQAAGGATSPETTYKHMVTRSAAVAIDAEPGGLIYVRQRRVANATSPQANFAGTVYVLSAGIQYQSTNLATIQDAPDFYADS
jgi:hypothetical protein